MHRNDVSQSLRTPLTIVKGVLRMLVTKTLDDLDERTRGDLLRRADDQLVKLEEAIEHVEDEFPVTADEVAVVLYVEEPLRA